MLSTTNLSLFAKIPVELQEPILDHLDLEDVLRLELISKETREEADIFWAMKFQQRFSRYQAFLSETTNVKAAYLVCTRIENMNCRLYPILACLVSTNNIDLLHFSFNALNLYYNSLPNQDTANDLLSLLIKSASVGNQEIYDLVLGNYYHYSGKTKVDDSVIIGQIIPKAFEAGSTSFLDHVRGHLSLNYYGNSVPILFSGKADYVFEMQALFKFELDQSAINIFAGYAKSVQDLTTLVAKTGIKPQASALQAAYANSTVDVVRHLHEEYGFAITKEDVLYVIMHNYGELNTINYLLNVTKDQGDKEELMKEVAEKQQYTQLHNSLRLLLRDNGFDINLSNDWAAIRERIYLEIAEHHDLRVNRA